MKVILLQDVAKIGKAGTVKDVKAGFGFNYLLPQGKASLVTTSSLRIFEKRSAKEILQQRNSAEESEKKAAVLAGKVFHLKRPAEKEKLFGSVTKEEISKELQTQGFAVLPGEIILEKAIKKTGTFAVSANFGNESTAKFEIEIQAE